MELFPRFSFFLIKKKWFWNSHANFGSDACKWPKVSLAMRKCWQDQQGDSNWDLLNRLGRLS
jgi:hypothetical protein